MSYDEGQGYIEKKMQALIPPTVVVRIGEQDIDISYACTFDCEAQTIELPDNLPGGSEVYVDGKYLTTTAVTLAERAEYVARSKRPLKRNLLAACVTSALYRDIEPVQAH